SPSMRGPWTDCGEYRLTAQDPTVVRRGHVPPALALEARARRDVRQLRLVGTVCRPALEHEAPVAVATIDIARLGDLHVDARVAERGRAEARAAADRAGAVARHAGGVDESDFGSVVHRRQRLAARPASRNAELNGAQLNWICTTTVPL